MKLYNTLTRKKEEFVPVEEFKNLKANNNLKLMMEKVWYY